MYWEWSEGVGKGVWRGGGVIKKKKVDLKLWAVYISGEEWICPVHRKSRNILKYLKYTVSVSFPSSFIAL